MPTTLVAVAIRTIERNTKAMTVWRPALEQGCQRI
jgi:hypothetical protein